MEQVVIIDDINWLEIFVGSFLTGLVAWSVAFLQFSLSNFNDHKNSIQNSVSLLNIFRNLTKKVVISSRTFSHYLAEYSELSLERFFNVPDQTLNTSSFIAVANIAYADLDKALRLLPYREKNIEKILKSYSSVQSIFDSYNLIRIFHKEKLIEYNKLVSELNSLNHDIAIGLQNLVFSKQHLELKSILPDLVDMGPFRKRYPHYSIYEGLDKQMSSYQKNKDIEGWIPLKELLEGVINVIRNANLSFPDILLAQNVTRALALIHALEIFYQSFNSTFDSYRKANDTYIETLQSIQILMPIMPINMNYWIYLKRNYLIISIYRKLVRMVKMIVT